MQLTGKQIIDEKIISHYDKDKAIQQQGVDMRVDSIKRVNATQCGFIPKIGKTELPNMGGELYPEHDEQAHYGVYNLAPGYYEVTLMEGVEIPSNRSLHFKSRSSLVRCGAIVHSGQFDAGFKTDQAGCYLQVLVPVRIERGARIAQAIVFETADVDNMYEGQWQNDKQRLN